MPHSVLIRGGNVLAPQGLQPGSDVLVDDGVIRRIGRDLPVTGAATLDARGQIVAPGLIDVHIHGAGGALCESGDPAQIAALSASLARQGVTAFLPTIATLAPDALRAAVRAVAAVAGHEPGARILGLHLEGPYLNPRRAGAQAAHWMRAPSIEEFDALYDLSGGLIRLITIAPELPGSVPFIRAVCARGVRVAAGHSDATAEQMELAVQAGVTHVTHLFNAMRPLHHREPGILGVALTGDTLSTELICDGHHLSRAAIALALRCKPPEKIVLVSDAVAAGCADGTHAFLGAACVVANGVVRLQGSGQLAGSCLSLAGALRALHAWQPQLPLADLLRMASANAAQALGRAAEYGRLSEGAPADVVLLDASLQVTRTLVGGVVVSA